MWFWDNINDGGFGGGVCDDNNCIQVPLFRVHQLAVLEILINHPFE